MSAVVIYNQLINEILKLVNKCTHTYTYIHIRGLIKFSSWKVHCTYNI